MKLKHDRYEKKIGTHYFNIEGVSNWDLNTIYKVLKSEEARAKIFSDGFRGSRGLLDLLEDYMQDKRKYLPLSHKERED